MFDELLHAKGKSYRRRGFTTELADQLIVTAAAAGSFRGAVVLVPEFEDGIGVIPEIPHELRIFHERNPEFGQKFFELLEVCFGLRSDEITQLWCERQKNAQIFIIQTEQGERIFFQQALCFRREMALFAVEIISER